MLILTKTRSTHCSVQFSLYSACLVSKLVIFFSLLPPPLVYFYIYILKIFLPFCHVTSLVCSFSPLLSCHIVGVFFFPSSVMSHRWCVLFPLFCHVTSFVFFLFVFSLLSCHIVGVLFSARFKRKSKAAHTHH